MKAKQGFTLVEIMIVVLIIGLLAAIAIPNFIKARNTSREKACLNNLRQIDGAVEQYAMEKNIAEGTAVTWDNLQPDYIKAKTKCPAGTADYTIPNVGVEPACPNVGANAGHDLTPAGS